MDANWSGFVWHLCIMSRCLRLVKRKTNAIRGLSWALEDYWNFFFRNPRLTPCQIYFCKRVRKLCMYVCFKLKKFSDSQENVQMPKKLFWRRVKVHSLYFELYDETFCIRRIFSSIYDFSWFHGLQMFLGFSFIWKFVGFIIRNEFNT